MRFFILGFLALMSMESFADSRITAVTRTDTGYEGYRLSIEGEVAHQLYDTLEGFRIRVQDGELTYLNKMADGIICSKLERKSVYSCFFTVGPKGID
jgi:hypothetical protein